LAAVRASCTTISAIDLGHIDLEKKSLQPLDNPFGPRSVTPVLGTISVSRLDIGLAEALGPASADFNRAHRPRYVFWGLLRCASCGASLTMISASHVGCAAARNKGTCTNRRTFSRAKVETRILDALATRLMDPALFTAFCEEHVVETNRLRAEATSGRRGLEAERARIERDLQRLGRRDPQGSVCNGCEGAHELDKRQNEIDAALQHAVEPPPVLQPSMAVLYREKVSPLSESPSA
jgi:site-specific DNA recombinase